MSLCEKVTKSGFAIVMFLAFFLVPFLAFADDGAEKSDEKDKVYISADKLVADTGNNTAEFIGNVNVRQGKTTINSDNLKIHYAKNAEKKQIEKNNDSIERIIATGNVTIEMEEGVAKSDKAEYETKTKKLVLTGENSRIKSGSNYVTGTKITLYRETGQITVEGDKKKRVEAVFYSNGKGIE